MAKKSKSKSNEDTSFPPDAAPVVSAPDDFDIDLSKEMGLGWALKSEGAIVCGRLVRRVKMPNGKDGKPRSFYQIRIRDGYEVIATDEESDDPIKLVGGDLVNVDNSSALDRLNDFCDDGGIYEVWIRYGAKIPISGGNTYWPATLKIKVVKPVATRD